VSKRFGAHAALREIDLVVEPGECLVLQLAAPLELYRRPATRFAATFVGSPAINLWPAVVRPRGERPQRGVSRNAAGAPSCVPYPTMAPASLMATAASSTQPLPAGRRSLRS